MKNVKTILSVALIIVMASSILHVHASDLPALHTLTSGTQLDIPTYDESWGLSFPQNIGNISSTAQTTDVVAIDFKISDAKVDEKLKSEWSNLFFTINIIEMLHPGWKNTTGSIADPYKEVYDQEIFDILDKDGKQVVKDVHGIPQMPADYFKNLKTGDVMFTVLFKNTGVLAKNFKVQSELYWDKVKSSVIQPEVTGKISHAFTSGVSNTEAYNFAKTVGSSQGISIGGQLKAGSSNGGSLTANYTYSMSQSITQSFSRSTTITSQENTTVDYTYKNETDHPIAIAIYRPVELFSIDYDSSNGAFTNLNNYANQWKIWKISIPDSFVYNHSDFVSLISQ